MGILHNLAVLSGASAPEGTDGNVHKWLSVTNFAWAGEETIDGVITETMTFDISVGGEPSAKARLWLNKEKQDFPFNVSRWSSFRMER